MKQRMLIAALAALLSTSGALTGLASSAQAADDTSKPVAVADTLDGLYEDNTYDVTDRMLQNDTGNGGVLTIGKITASDNDNVKVTLNDGRVTIQVLHGAGGAYPTQAVTATFTYEVYENGDATNASDPATNTVPVEHTYDIVVKKVAGHKVRYTNKNDAAAMVKVTQVQGGRLDNKITVPANSSKTIKRKHRYQQWRAWLLVPARNFLGYGTIS